MVEAGVRDLVVVQAALLHDTVEDTDTTPQELIEVFGDTVAAVVAEVCSNNTVITVLHEYCFPSRVGIDP